MKNIYKEGIIYSGVIFSKVLGFLDIIFTFLFQFNILSFERLINIFMQKIKNTLKKFTSIMLICASKLKLLNYIYI